jgi:hypothetical protein
LSEERKEVLLGPTYVTSNLRDQSDSDHIVAAQPVHSPTEPNTCYQPISATIFIPLHPRNKPNDNIVKKKVALV